MTDHTTIEVTPRSQLTQAERAEILSLCTAAYGIDFDPVITSFGDYITHVLLRHRDELVSHALWITRWLQVGNGPLLRTAYIEAVATHPKHRRQGYASSVMRATAQAIQNFDIGALSPSAPRFYSRLGWDLWSGPLLIRSGTALTTAPPEEQAMILRLPKTPELTLHESLSIEWREGEVW